MHVANHAVVKFQHIHAAENGHANDSPEDALLTEHKHQAVQSAQKEPLGRRTNKQDGKAKAAESKDVPEAVSPVSAPLRPVTR